MSDFPNFDQLVKLANENPDEFERFRQKQVDLLINQASTENRRRLRGLQFQIDAQRKLHSNSPMGACVKISQMMHASFAELRVWLNDVTGLTDPIGSPIENSNAVKVEKALGKVIPFSVS